MQSSTAAALIRAGLTLASIAWAAAGCGSGFSLRVPSAPKECARIAAGPTVVKVFEFDAAGTLKPRGDWTYDANQNVDAAVAARVKQRGGRTFVAADVAHTDVTSDDFRHWASGALQEIAGQVAGSKPSAHRSVGEWQYPQSLTTWRAALGADFALSTLFIDAYEPAAPTGTGATGSTSSRYDAAQTGIVCLVDLGDSRIVVCAPSTGRFGDLRTPDGARDAVADVVGKICG
jgi:hypothetical protein